MVASIDILDDAYRHELSASVKERILLVRRVISDGKEVAYMYLEKNSIDPRLGRTSG
ncbi:MAG: hypothetical protein QN720_12950 [Nitrososphaeraceae archaeon]|nr:hypothetical protein [Nitrososphaeraceae archaeon]MDW0333858.1 hypothetical protein [Nitrososphaeraceae archaeon]